MSINNFEASLLSDARNLVIRKKILAVYKKRIISLFVNSKINTAVFLLD